MLLSNDQSVEHLAHIISAGGKSTADLEKLRAITDAAKSTSTNASQLCSFLGMVIIMANFFLSWLVVTLAPV